MPYLGKNWTVMVVKEAVPTGHAQYPMMVVPLWLGCGHRWHLTSMSDCGHSGLVPCTLRQLMSSLTSLSIVTSLAWWPWPSMQGATMFNIVCPKAL